MKKWFCILCLSLSSYNWAKDPSSVEVIQNNSSIKLDKLILYSFPQYNNEHKPWDPLIPFSDPNGYPDIIVYITGTSGKYYADLSGTNYTIYNADPHDSPHTFNIYTATDIIDLSDTLLITFYDDDFFDPDDLMGQLCFPVNQINSNLLCTGHTSTISACVEMND